MTVNTPGGGVTAEDAADLILLLRAVPEFVTEHQFALKREERTGEPCETIEWRHDPTGVLLHYDGEAARIDYEYEEEAEFDLPDNERAEIDALISEVVDEVGPGSDAATVVRELDARLASRLHAYNQAPQAELAGLSPDQVRRLLLGWTHPDVALRLRRDLPLDRFAAAERFLNARMLLTHIAQHGPLGATPAGNLQIAAVRDLFEKLHCEPDYRDAVVNASRRMTEQDVWPLHKARVLAQVAGLIRRRKNRFELKKAAAALLDDRRSGELYALLFETQCRRFNLAYGTRMDWPELQQQVAFTLCRLSRIGEVWRTPEQCVDETMVLPTAMRGAPHAASFDLVPFAFARLLLEPLVGFGLLEHEEAGDKQSLSLGRYRATPLLAEFLRFDF